MSPPSGRDMMADHAQGMTDEQIAEALIEQALY